MGNKGFPSNSRSKGIKKRKNTLLREYHVRDKNNLFVDRRIGEKSKTMSAEDKALARFAAERMRSHKKRGDIFNLNDEEVLTHRGQSLMEIEKYDDPRSDEDEYSDDENKGGQLSKKFVAEAHFGGGLFSKVDPTTSRKDVIDQLIADSKKRKAERQKIREQTIDLTEKLDAEWKDLLPLVVASNKDIEPVPEDTKADDFDVTMRQLKFEARGAATDKLKSEEQVEKEKRVKVEEAEKERLERMKDFEEESFYKQNHRSADDLDDFYIEKIQEKDEDEEEDGEEEEGEESEEENEVEEEEEGDDEDEEEEEEEEDENEEDNNFSDLKSDSSDAEDEEVKEVIKKPISAPISEKDKVEKERKEALEEIRQETPQTIDVPKSLKSFKKLMSEKTFYKQGITLERIIQSNSCKTSPENKNKLLKLFALSMAYLDECAVQTENTADFFKLFNELCPQLYDLVQISPEETTDILKSIIKEKHEEFQKKKKSYPNLDVLYLFKLVSLLYPTSDFKHPVVTPCFVFMSQILLRCKVLNKSHIAKGLFLSTLFLEYTVLSKRWCPSVINFLRGIIYSALLKPISGVERIIPPFETLGKFSSLLVLENNHKETTMDPTKPQMKFSDLEESDLDDDFRLRAFVTAVNLVDEFRDQCAKLDAVFAIFEPILRLLKNGSFKNYPENVKERVKVLVKNLENEGEKRIYALAIKKTIKALRMYDPRIVVIRDGKNRNHTSKDKAEEEKLRYKLKKETKGAIREIRRDAAFLSKVKIKQQIRGDEERKRKVKEIFGDAANQQHELKKFKKK